MFISPSPSMYVYLLTLESWTHGGSYGDYHKEATGLRFVKGQERVMFT